MLDVAMAIFWTRSESLFLMLWELRRMQGYSTSFRDRFPIISSQCLPRRLQSQWMWPLSVGWSQEWTFATRWQRLPAALSPDLMLAASAALTADVNMRNLALKESPGGGHLHG